MWLVIIWKWITHFHGKDCLREWADFLVKLVTQPEGKKTTEVPPENKQAKYTLTYFSTSFGNPLDQFEPK